MKVTLTIKLIPESRDEMISSFGRSYRKLREDFEQFQKEGQLSPDLLQAMYRASLRWIIESGRWD